MSYVGGRMVYVGFDSKTRRAVVRVEIMGEL